MPFCTFFLRINDFLHMFLLINDSFHTSLTSPDSPYHRLVASMVYYGLSLNAEDLSGDIYLNFFLLAIVELAAYIFCLIFLDKSGRKFLQCFSMVLGGVACIATLFPVIYGGDGKNSPKVSPALFCCFFLDIIIGHICCTWGSVPQLVQPPSCDLEVPGSIPN